MMLARAAFGVNDPDQGTINSGDSGPGPPVVRLRLNSSNGLIFPYISLQPTAARGPDLPDMTTQDVCTLISYLIEIALQNVR